MSEDQSLAYPIVGPVVIGSCFQMMLFGILMCTYYNFYFTPAYQRTTPVLRWTIAVVVVLTAFLTFLYVHDLWFYSSLINSTLTPLIVGTGIQTVEPLLTGIVAAIVQTLLIVRGARLIKSLRGRVTYFVVTGILALASFIGSCFATAWSVEFHFDATASNTHFFKIDFPSSLAIWMWCSAACDAAVSVLYIILIRRQMKVANEVAHGVLQRLVSITMRSASYTALLAVVSAIMSLSFTLDGKFNTNCIPYAFWIPLSSFYALSMFTTLSAGDTIMQEFGKKDEIEAIRVQQWSQGLGVSSHSSDRRRSSGCTKCGDVEEQKEIDLHVV